MMPGYERELFTSKSATFSLPVHHSVGQATVPSGPTACRKPSMTVLGPPTTSPMLESELWNMTVSPGATPTSRKPAATVAAVTLICLSPRSGSMLSPEG